MKYSYSKIKDIKLREQRGISFEEIIAWIDKGFLVDMLTHPNREKYTNQELLIVNINEYAWAIPCEQREDKLHLITAYKSRKYTKLYLGIDK